MYKILFLIISLFMIMYSVTKTTEGFANSTPPPSSATGSTTITAVPITSDNVADYIYKVYKADVKAIQNLADIAMKLQTGGVTVPGNMTIVGDIKTSSIIGNNNNADFFIRTTSNNKPVDIFQIGVGGAWTNCISNFRACNLLMCDKGLVGSDATNQNPITIDTQNNLNVPHSIYADRLYINTDKAKIDDNGTALFNATTLYGNLSFTQKDSYISLIADGALRINHPGWNTYNFGRSLFDIYTDTKIHGSLTVNDVTIKSLINRIEYLENEFDKKISYSSKFALYSYGGEYYSILGPK